MIITIDGPTASGKSTLAKKVAQHYCFYYIYSGLLFRAVGYILVKYAQKKEQELAKVSKEELLPFVDPKRLSYLYDSLKGAFISYDSIDVTPELKSASCDVYSSILGTNADARKLLDDFQRELAKQHDVVVDGRDSGTIVFPEADYKFFLTASVEKRAARWLKDQERRGLSFNLEQAIAAITERDNRDSHRDVCPCLPAPDAIIIDNSELNSQQTFELLCSHIKL